MNILVCDDDKEISEAIRIYLANEVLRTGIVAIPFINSQPILSKQQTIKKIGQFDFEIEFDSREICSLVMKCVEKISAS